MPGTVKVGSLLGALGGCFAGSGGAIAAAPRQNFPNPLRGGRFGGGFFFVKITFGHMRCVMPSS